MKETNDMETIQRIFRNQSWRWVYPDGTEIPMITGGAEDGDPPGGLPETLDELYDARAEVLTEIDSILETAAEDEDRDLTDEERTRHDELVTRHDELAEAITSQEADATRAERQGQQRERSRRASVRINRITEPAAGADRSLDELLWASPGTVQAGQIARSGHFIPTPGVTHAVEQVVVRTKDDAQHAAAPLLSNFLTEHRPVVERFQALVKEMCLVGMLNERKAVSSADGFIRAKAMPQFRERWQAILRAMDVDTAGEGAEWVPTGIGMDLHRKVRAAGRVAPLFARVDMPTNPWKWPLEAADATAYRVAEPTSDTEAKPTASTPGTGAPTFDAEIFGARALFSRSVEADSVLAIMGYVEGKIVQAFIDAEEKAILDGDSDGAHQDSDVGVSTTDARTAWDGLRKKGLAETGSDAANASATAALIRAGRALMGKWGLNPAQLAWIVGVATYHNLLGDDDLRTLDKLGPQATVLNGQLGALDGIPVIVSEHVREDLNAAGVHDGVTTDRTWAACVNRGEFAIGQRMGLDVEADDSIYRETFQRVLVGFSREDFQHIGDAAANDDVAAIYNLAT